MKAVLGLTMCAAAVCSWAGEAFAEPKATRQSTPIVAADDSIESGRKALARWPRSPWYDAQADRVRPIEVDESQEPRPKQAESSAAGGAVEALAWIATACALAALVGAFLWAYLRGDRRWAASVASDTSDVADDQRHSEALPAAARRRLDLPDEARRLYKAGRYGEAIVLLFSYQLVRLDQRQHVRLAKGKTNRQYLRELGSRGALRSLFEQTMLAFEDVFFGNQTIDRKRFESCWSRLAEFEALAAEETV